MIINLILLFALVFAALWTVTTPRLIRSIVGLALTSAILSAVMYRLDSPLAAVFELSVCAGLISVIFVVTISFTGRVSKEELVVRKKQKLTKYLYLPLILAAAGILLQRFLSSANLNPAALPAQGLDVRNVLWNMRHLDLFGQAVILLVGALGVVALFKEVKK